MSLSVIGAGFGRTGTLSLKTALEILGHGPCYHMMEVFHHPPHAALWHAAANDNADWDTLLAGYQSCVDWPGSYFWKELTQYYPEAKVILSQRDGERWYQSVCDTIYPALNRAKTAADSQVLLDQRAMARELILERTFAGRFEDKAHAIAVYERHNAEVQNTISPERLLVFRAADGWEPLCKFLDCPVPAEAFPQVNSTSEFKARFEE